MSAQDSTHELPDVTRRSIRGPGRRTTVVNKVNPVKAAQRRQSNGEILDKRPWGRCQLWKTEHMIVKPLEYMAVSRKNGNKTLKKSFPHSHDQYDYFCPNCDIYFLNYDDYQTHLLYQTFMQPYKRIVNDFDDQISAIQRQEMPLLSKAIAGEGTSSSEKKRHTKSFREERKFFNEQEMFEEYKTMREKSQKVQKKLRRLQVMRGSRRNLAAFRRGTIFTNDLNPLLENRRTGTVLGDNGARVSRPQRRITNLNRMTLSRPAPPPGIGTGLVFEDQPDT